MKLSILILTVPRRGDLSKRVIESVVSQAKGREVEVLWLGDNKTRSIGEKRNNLINLSKGDYVVFIDDDDRVSDDYVELMLAAQRNKPDVIVFQSEYTYNGKDPKPVYYDCKFSRNVDHTNSFDRVPDQKCCWRKELIPDNPFILVNFGEDSDFAFKMYPKIKTQAKINKTIYFHEYNSEISESG